jgi:hypothetical protein
MRDQAFESPFLQQRVCLSAHPLSKVRNPGFPRGCARSCPIEQRDVAIDLNSTPLVTMTNLLNLTHTTRHLCGRLWPPASRGEQVARDQAIREACDMQSGRSKGCQRVTTLIIGYAPKPVQPVAKRLTRLASRDSSPYRGNPARRGERRMPLCAASIMKYRVICTMSVRQ